MSNKILIMTGDKLRHKYYASSILSKIDDSFLLIEKQTPVPWGSHLSNPSELMKKHFIDFNKAEEIYFGEYIENKRDLIASRTLLIIEEGEINNKNIINEIKNIDPMIICTLSTSILKDNFINSFNKKTIINYHAGLSPYYRGSGTNVFPFLFKELEYIGITLHYIDTGLDSGDIILQGRPLFDYNDNTNTIGCKNIILGAELMIEIIKSYIDKGPPKGVKQDLSRGRLFYKKDFNEDVIIKINELISGGLVKEYIKKQPLKLDIVKKLVYE